MKALLSIFSSLAVVIAADEVTNPTIEELEAAVRVAQGAVGAVYQSTKEIYTCSDGYTDAVTARAKASANLIEAQKRLADAQLKVVPPAE